MTGLSLLSLDTPMHANGSLGYYLFGKDTECALLCRIFRNFKKINMELTIIETSAYQELRKLVSTLAVQMGDFQKKIAPPAPDK